MADDDNNLKQMSKSFLSTKSSSDIPDALKNEDFQSFFPTVEIVELNGETQAALVTSRKLNDVEFDHVRYKVMKSDMFQKNLLVGNRKETQFDGLMQYLQDYSFQELLANNNVVIIEPVRTKIEKVAEKPREAQSAACKITNGALNRNGSKNLKTNFFYHPIRVNKELYEEELPVPDTVRNVRKLFEESLRLGAPTKVDDKPAGRKTIRYLTIDTSFDNSNLGVSKWDSISLSSGISSAADLNSPCECQDSSNRDIKFVCKDENLDNDEDNEDDDGEFKSHFVSADVLEKIRECGSSITYYGGQTTAEGKKMSSDAMTKAIMREINGQKCSCPTRKTSRHSEKFVRKVSEDFSGMKFKLVKSNSCSSRLELTGTGLERGNSDAMEEMRNIIHNQMESSSSDNEHKKDLCEQEETVKDMVSRLESKSFAGVPTKPRIIESKCIEKTTKDSSPNVTINHQSFEEKVKPIVTVNNHANSGSIVPQDEAALKPVRNKNVDLAMAAMATKKTRDTENLAPVEPPHTKKWGNISKMESVEMVKHQDKLNVKLSQKSSDEKTVKMVNWSTMGTVVGKEYIANDCNLIQTKIYDEMEFEEFEVMGEHYDSLNSK